MASNCLAARASASNGRFRGLGSWIPRGGVQVQVLRLLLLLLNQGDNLCHRSCGLISPLTSRSSAPGAYFPDPSFQQTGVLKMSQRLGDLLVKEKIITPEQLQQASKVQRETSCRLGSALVKLNFLTDEDVTNFLSRQYGVPAINLSYFEIDPSVVKLIPYETAKRYQILPLSRVGASLTIAMVDPTNVFAMDDIKFMTGFNIEPVVAAESSILDGIEKAYNTSKEDDLDKVMQSMSDMDEADVELQSDAEELALADLEKAADEAPIVKLVNLVLTDAVKRGASDIHIEPYEKEFRVGFAIAGFLQSIMPPPVKLKDAITSR